MNKDLISRKWLTDAIRNRRTYLSYEDAKDVIDLIDNAPAVDIKDEIAGAYNEGYMCGNKEAEKGRPQGEWLKNANEIYKCSLCGAFGNPNYFRFCPNCGAKMKGGVMNETSGYKFGIKVNRHFEGAWSFGSCISHSFGETYLLSILQSGALA